MIGPFFTRGLMMVFGYAYPAYECFKTVEMNKPEIEHLRFWCQYWILVAVLTVCEKVGDAFISWVPMYSEAKLAFYIYLWYPKTKGTTYIYDSFFRPYVAKHEVEIDRNLLELRTRAGDIAVLYWQRAASYGQTRIGAIFQYIASQSTPRPLPAQRKQNPTKPASKTQSQIEEPPSPSSSEDSDEYELPSPSPSKALTTKALSTKSLPTKAPTAQKATITQPPEKTTSSQPSTEIASNASKAEEIQADAVTLKNENVKTLPEQETVMDEAIRVTRSRLRKTRSVLNSGI